jgi:hypothetical protein
MFIYIFQVNVNYMQRTETAYCAQIRSIFYTLSQKLLITKQQIAQPQILPHLLQLENVILFQGTTAFGFPFHKSCKEFCADLLYIVSLKSDNQFGKKLTDVH